MPLNTSTYLSSQGWAGVGVPLDGAGGRGLKKPLAIPQKRSLTGIGKDRDRANEWWDSIFTAGAKSLSIGASRSSTPDIVTTTTVAANPTSSSMARLSLASSAKREHARKTLMSSFIRGQVISSKEPSPQPTPSLPPTVPTASAVASTSKSQLATTSNSAGDVDKPSKSDRKALKEARRLLTAQKAARKAANELRREQKRLKNEAKAAKKAKKMLKIKDKASDAKTEEQLEDKAATVQGQRKKRKRGQDDDEDDQASNEDAATALTAGALDDAVGEPEAPTGTKEKEKANKDENKVKKQKEAKDKENEKDAKKHEDKKAKKVREAKQGKKAKGAPTA